MHTTMWFLGMAFWFPILFYLGMVRWEPAPNKLKDDEEKRRWSYAFKIGSIPCCAGPCPCRCQNPGQLLRLRLFPRLVAFHGFAAPGRRAKTRVDRSSTRDFALYLGFGRAGLCRGRNPG